MTIDLVLSRRAMILLLGCALCVSCSDCAESEKASGDTTQSDGLWLGIEPPPPPTRESSNTFKRGPKPPAKPDTRALKVLEAIKAPTSKPAVETRALAVLRTQPTGDIGHERHISVTFNQPMVSLERVGDVPAERSPLRLAPEVPGHFEWVGTRTLTFRADKSLPFSTAFTATVAKGTASSSGQVLDEDVSFTFKTPTLRVLQALPRGEHVPPTAAVVMRFNQEVSSQELVKHLRVKAAQRDIELRVISLEEASKRLKQPLPESVWPEAQTLAVAPVRELAIDTEVKISLNAGAPSAEGPLTSAETIQHTFTTFGPMRVESGSCSNEYGFDLKCDWMQTPIVFTSEDTQA